MIMLFSIFLFRDDTYASENNTAQESIKIGYIENWGMIIEEPDSDNRGYAYEYFKEIGQHTGHSYEFIKMEWKDIESKLETGEIDLFGTMGSTPEREKNYEFTDRAFGYEEIILVAPEGTDISYNETEAIHNKNVAALEDTSMMLEYLNSYLEKNDISVVSSPYAGAKGLEEGAYDLEVTGTLLDQEDRKVVAKLGVMPLYFVAKKGNTELIGELNLALEEINSNNMYFEQDLNNKYFRNTKMAMPNLTKEDKLLLDKKGNAFTVLISTDHIPLSYIDEDGNASGILVDIMEMIAIEGGIEFNYVFETESINVDYNTIDLSISLVDNTFLEHSYVETDEYFELPMMAVGKTVTDIKDLGTIGLLDYHKFKPAVADKKICNTIDEMIDFLKDGELEFIVVTSLSTTYILDGIGVDGHSIYPTGSTMPMKMTLSNEGSEYVDVFNKLIGRLDQDEIQAIVVEQAYQDLSEHSIFEYFFKNPSMLIGIMLLIMLIGVVIILSMHRIKKKALYEIINKDELTGLLSLRKFHEMASKRLQLAKPNEYLLLSVDIDNFQYINEIYGYDYGSRVLVILAIELSDCYGKDALIAREKDDKFLILTLNQEEIKNEQAYDSCNHNISDSICEILGKSYKVSMSKGKYLVYNSLENLEYMIDCAHCARMLGKQNYGNTLFDFSEEMRLERTTKNIIVTTMEEAIKNKEFKVFYQPKVELKGKGLIGAEALVRWCPEGKDMLYPDSFIPLFEKNGFITSLDYYVFEEVCSFISRHQDKIPLLSISINLSAITLLDENLIDKLTNITNKYNIDKAILEIEITESAIVKNLEKAIEKIDLLKKVGYVISLDDFGSGQSSLNRLKDLHIDILKIDREFLSASLRDKKGITIIKNIIKMAKEINILTIAEGVETKEHVAFLQALDCDFAQGFYFGKPMSEKDFKIISSNHAPLDIENEETQQQQIFLRKIRQQLESNNPLLLSVFQTMPLNIIVVNSKLEILLFNEFAFQLFGCKTEEEFLLKFRDLSPLHQPDGTLSADAFKQRLVDAYRDGQQVFEWIHCDASEVPIPCMITLVKSNIIDDHGCNLMIGYIEDRRGELLRCETEAWRDKRAKAILDAAPFTHNTWTRDYKTSSGNKQAYELFGVENEEQYLTEFFNLSPEFQPNGRESYEFTKEIIQKAFDTGYGRFKWLHINLEGEEIPSEITLVKIDEIDGVGGDFLAAFSRDLRDNMASNVHDELFDSYFLNQISDKVLFNTISMLSDELFFTFDLRTSQIQYFGKMRSILEISEGKRVFPDAAIQEERIFHEDIPLIKKLVDNMKNGICEPTDIRFVTPDGEYRYFRFIYHVIFDEENYPVFTVGKAADIQEQRDLQVQATTDLLTSCYNNITTEIKISSILSTSEKNQEHALFIVDIDDFKNVNDNLGHHFGDFVLAEVANILKSHFSNEDIVGRIGGDEFIVLMKNFSHREEIVRKVNDIISSFQKTYSGENEDYTISASVGIARYPLDGNAYVDLYKAADKALYESKRKGKNCFTFYGDSFLDGALNNATPYVNAKRTANMYFDADLTSTLFDLLYSSKDIKASINTALEILGEKIDVDRCSIYESFDEGHTYDNTYEWCKDGISVELENLQGLTKEILADCFVDASKEGIVYCNDLTNLTAEGAYQLMADQNIKSFLYSQTKVNGFVKEFIGVDDCHSPRIWKEKEINTILYTRKIISIFLLIENAKRIDEIT